MPLSRQSQQPPPASGAHPRIPQAAQQQPQHAAPPHSNSNKDAGTSDCAMGTDPDIQKQQQQRQERKGLPAAGWVTDNTPSSMLLFTGGPDVHALADYLLEMQGYRGLQQVRDSKGIVCY